MSSWILVLLFFGPFLLYYLLFSVYSMFYDKIVLKIFYVGINIAIEEKHILENMESTIDFTTSYTSD